MRQKHLPATRPARQYRAVPPDLEPRSAAHSYPAEGPDSRRYPVSIAPGHVRYCQSLPSKPQYWSDSPYGASLSRLRGYTSSQPAYVQVVGPAVLVIIRHSAGLGQILLLPLTATPACYFLDRSLVFLLRSK